MDFYGLHGDDRSEKVRCEQVAALGSIAGPAIVAGDLNGLWRHTRTARTLRALRPVADTLYSRDPTSYRDSVIARGRLGSLARRLCSMAEGTMLETLSKSGLKDADPTMQPTKGIVQLDHILITDGLAIDSFTAHNTMAISDHKPISARLGLIGQDVL